VSSLAHHPVLLLAVSFPVLWLSTWIGAVLSRRLRTELESAHDDFTVVQGATLTLLALIVGFTFSMAVTRYDQRKNYEEAEANAIGTEFVRAELLPPADAAKVRALLLQYLGQRILYYTAQDPHELEQVDSRTATLQKELWSAVVAPGLAQPTVVSALAVAGMNDVLNSQGYTTAAWLNQIPEGAWRMMVVIAVCSTLLIGVGARDTRVGRGLFVVLPAILSIAFFLIADIDSPRYGVIRVVPQNLELLLPWMTGR